MLKKFFGEIKSLNLSEKLLLSLVFVLPFERIPSLEVGGLTIKLSLIIGSALIIISGFNTARNSHIKEHKLDLISLGPVVLPLYSLASYFWAVDTSAWLKANLILGFVTLLFYEVWRVIVEGKNSKKLIDLVIKTVLVSTLVIISFGFFQWFGDLLGLPASLTGIRTEYTALRLGLPRMHSTLLEPLYFSLFLLLPLGLSLADRKNELFKQLGYRVGFIALIYLSILLSLARGAIVASATMGIIALIYNYSELKRQLNLKLIYKFISVFILLIVFLSGAISLLGKKGTDEDNNYSRGIGTLVGHLETIRPWGNTEDKEDENSINSRDEARKEAWGVITNSPKNVIFGVGAGQYGASLEPTKGPESTSNFVLLDVWAKYGLIGLSLLLIFGISLILKVSLKDPISFGLVLYLIGFGIQSITFGELAITHLWLVLAVLAGRTEL